MAKVPGGSPGHPWLVADSSRRSRPSFGSVVLAIVLAAGPGCAECVERYLMYTSQVDTATVGQTQDVISGLVAKWDMRIEAASYRHPIGRVEFDAHLFYDRRAQEERQSFLWITGSERFVSLIFLERGDMPREVLDKFAYELKHELEERLGLQFCRENRYGVCDEEYARRDAIWEASVERRLLEAGQ